MRTVIEVFGLILVLFTFLPIIPTTNRWIRMLDFPRMQIAVFLLLLLTAYVCMGIPEEAYSLIFISLTGFALLIQAWMIFPFTVFAPIRAVKYTQAQPDRMFSILISNVRMENTHKKEFIELVQNFDPDMMLVNEPDHTWAKALEVLEKKYTYSVKKPLDNTYGMLFFSRLPLENSQVLYRIEDGIPSIVTQVVLRSGERFCFYGVHPQPPTPSNDTEKREAELLLVGKEIKKKGEPSLVAGDLNDVGWSRTTSLFKKVSGMLDPRIGRGFFNTYNVFVPFFRYPLDHIFYSPHFQLVDMQRLPAFGSDHFPILIRLQFAPSEKPQQPVEYADHEEKQEANDLINEGLASASEANTLKD